MSKMKNVEIKSRCMNPIALKEKLLSLGAVDKGVDHQIDTYFNSDFGRLKLRRGNIENSLIFYNRENKKDAKVSSIFLEKLNSENNLVALLEASNGIKTIVDKKRNILFIENAKFHIDEVVGLGSFMEIEIIDRTGKISVEDLNKKCQFYIEELGLDTTLFIDCSYSDLIIEKEEKLRCEAHKFLKIMDDDLSKLKLDLEQNFLDHLCYRVEDNSAYKDWKSFFNLLGEELIESEIGGRMIATFKLRRPIEYKNREISLIELPSFKNGQKYKEGFEHAEFVISEDFDDFIARYPKIDFDTKAVTKAHNPELRIKLNSQSSIKLHHKSLEVVIEEEKKLLNT